MIAAARKFKHRRLPIYDETPDTIVGILNTRALLLDPEIDLAEAIEFPSFVPETMNLLQLFKSLQRQQRGMAIVLDEFGGTAGLVTMEDILGEMVGKIRGEDGGGRIRDGEAGAGPLAGQRHDCGLDDFRREYPGAGRRARGGNDGRPAVASAGGGARPRANRHVFRGLKLTAQVADERRVRELLVERTRLARMNLDLAQLDRVRGLCLALSFLLSGMEAGVFALSRAAHPAADAGRTRARPGCCTVTWRTRRTSSGPSWSATPSSTLLILGWLILLLQSQLRRQPRWSSSVLFVVLVFLFYALVRPAAQDAVPRLSQPALPRCWPGPSALSTCALRPLVCAGGVRLRLPPALDAAARSSPAACSATARSCARSCRNPPRASPPRSAP